MKSSWNKLKPGWTPSVCDFNGHLNRPPLCCCLWPCDNHNQVIVLLLPGTLLLESSSSTGPQSHCIHDDDDDVTLTATRSTTVALRIAAVRSGSLSWLAGVDGYH